MPSSRMPRRPRPRPAAAVAIATLILVVAGSAFGQSAGLDGYRGLSVSTPFPAQTVQPGESTDIELTIRNYGLPPQRVDLAVDGAPDGWSVELLGGGRPVDAVFVAPGGSADVRLRLVPPETAPAEGHALTVRAEGDDGAFALPLTVTVGEVRPPRLRLEAEFPELTGSPSTAFEYRLTVENDSTEDALVRLQADAPAGFQVEFREAFGSRVLTSLPIAAGESEEVDVTVDLPQRAEAGRYELVVEAASEAASAERTLALVVTGQPSLRVTGLGGRLSADATVGRETPLTVVVANDGSAPAEDVSLSATEPSGWEVRFEPESLDTLAAGEQREATAYLVPADDALAGDYVVSMRASGEGASDRAEFRITVRTSTTWGIVAVAIIAAALLVIVIAVMRYGRR